MSVVNLSVDSFLGCFCRFKHVIIHSEGGCWEFYIFSIVLLCGRKSCGEYHCVTCFELFTYSYFPFSFYFGCYAFAVR